MKKRQRHTYRFNPHTLKYEKVFVSLREYLADGLEHPFLVRGDDRVYTD